MKVVLTIVALVMFQFAFTQSTETKKDDKAEKDTSSTQKSCDTEKKGSCCDSKAKAVEKSKGGEGKAKSSSCCTTEKKATATENKKEKK